LTIAENPAESLAPAVALFEPVLPLGLQGLPIALRSPTPTRRIADLVAGITRD